MPACRRGLEALPLLIFRAVVSAVEGRLVVWLARLAAEFRLMSVVHPYPPLCPGSGGAADAVAGWV